MIQRVLLIGAGIQGREYAKVLSAMGVSYDVIGRGEKNAESFQKVTGKSVIAGGVKNGIDKLEQKPTHVIIAVGDYDAYEVAKTVLDVGYKKILLEKPGGSSLAQIEDIAKISHENNASVSIAYNRRYYASVSKALEIIEEDGGVTSFFFEFTEWLHMFENKINKGSLDQLLYGNSGHVIDMAFFLGGKPETIKTFVKEKLSWEGHNRVFAGSGITKNGVLFSYMSNWDAPGRWGVEVMTNRHRLYFRPLEKLQIQEMRSVAVKEVEIDNQIDIDFKPGLYREVEAFLYDISDNKRIFIDEQIENWKVFNAIKNGQIM